MRIAICLSGQPRSIEFASKSILQHFNNSAGNHTYDFFCHCWDYNTWKLQNLTFSKDEVVDRIWLQYQLDKFSPKSYIIDSKNEVEVDRFPGGWNNVVTVPYGSLLYSAMISNYLKRDYERQHNFRYDCVIKLRYDSVFRPEPLPAFPEIIPQRTLYFPHCGRFPLEYTRFNATDCLYYGDSWGMDMASDLYRYLRNRLDMLRKYDDYDCFGPGTLMTEYCNNHNIEIKQATNWPEIIYRREVMGLDPTNLDEFNKIFDMHSSFYTKKKF